MTTEWVMIVVVVVYGVIGASIITDVWVDFKLSGWIKRKIGWNK